MNTGKKYYSVTELSEMGFSRKWLYKVARADSRGYYAAKLSGGKNSKLVFRLDRLQTGLERGYLQRSIAQ